MGKWIKVYVEDLETLLKEDMSLTERSIWADFLLLSCQEEPQGLIKIPLTEIAEQINVSMETLMGAIAKFICKGLIRITGFEISHFTNYVKENPK